jgi:hypothetical protein
MNSGARWLADERIGRHDFDLGGRDTNTQPSAFLGGKDGDPTKTAPHVYPFVECMDKASFDAWCLIVADAGLAVSH